MYVSKTEFKAGSPKMNLIEAVELNQPFLQPMIHKEVVKNSGSRITLSMFEVKL